MLAVLWAFLEILCGALGYTEISSPPGYKLQLPERKSYSGIGKLKILIKNNQQNGFNVSEILENTKSFLTLRKAVLSHRDCSKYTRNMGKMLLLFGLNQIKWGKNNFHEKWPIWYYIYQSVPVPEK